MKVVTRLAINALLPAILALAVIAAVVVMNEEIMTSQREVSAASRVKDDILELNLLTTAYLLDPRRSNEQFWLSHYESSAQNLFEINFTDPPRQALLLRIRKNFSNAATLFSQLAKSHSGDTPANSPAWLSPLEQRLVQELRVNNRFISSDISRLTAATQQKLADRLVAGTVLLILFTLLISGLTAALQWKVNRRIARAIGLLEHGTNVIASGNLEYKVGTESEDEIGQLSRSFDHMADQLKTSTVSRDALAREIEERKQTEQALRTSEANYRAMFDSANDAIFVLDIDTGEILDVNQRMLEMYKYTCGELEGLSVEELSAGIPGYTPQETARFIRLAAEGKPQVFEWIARDKEGREFWVEVSLKRVSLGGRARLLAMVRDASERKRAEEALKESEERFRAAFAHAPIGMVMNDLEGRFLHVNQAYCDIVGYSAQELLRPDFNFRQMTHPDDLERNLEDWNRLITGEIPAFFLEKRYIRTDGRIVWARISAIVRRDAGQRPFLTVGLVEDITERRRADEVKARLSAIVESADDAIISETTDGVIQTWNKGAERIYGYTAEEAIGKHISLLAPPERRSQISGILDKIVRGERIEHFETVRKRKDGTRLHVSIAVSPIVKPEGGITGASIIAHDITEQVRTQEVLKLTQFSVDHASVSVFFVAPDARFLYVNEQACRSLGYTREELLSMAVYDIDPGRPLSSWNELWKQIKKERSLHFETVHHNKDGASIPMEMSINYVSFAGREYIVAFGLNISERKKAVQELARISRQNELILESAGDGIFGMNSSGNHILVNRAALKMLGYESADLMGRHSHSIWHHTRADGTPYPDKECLIYQTARDGKARTVQDEVFWRKDGTSVPVEYTTNPVYEGRNLVGTVVTFRDITKGKRAQEALVESENRFRAFFESVAVGTVQLDARSGKFLRMNKRFCAITGYACDELRSLTFSDLTHPDDRAGALKRYKRMIDGEDPVYETEKRYVRKDGSVVWVHVSASLVRDANGRPLHTAAVVQDVSSRKKMEDEIRHMAQHDALTGLPNRRLFIDILDVELALTRRHGKKLGILFLDLDRFKEINDTLGHATGDELLKQVAGRFRNTIRTSDTVARIGGDEFNIVLTSVNRSEDISDIARKIVESFREPVFLSGRELQVTTSIGISIYPDDSEDVNSLLRYADIAMYHAKATGRNRYAFFNPAINIRSLDRMKFENYLSHTIARDELLLRYQPEIDIATGKIVCVEALLRWQHPELGLLKPGKFIPVAEETGYITRIDDWVLRKACRQMKTWSDAGLDSFCLTVNLSARQFQNPDLIQTISRILEETATDPRRLVLEVTEGTAMSNIERTRSTMQRLSEMGIRISIDDFGTGCSSLNYLKRLPVERLKIDNSFIQDIATDADDRAIVQAISAMAHSMKMKVTAEGVETEEQLALVRKAGCEEMQGNLFSEPVSAEELGRLIGAK